MPTVRLRFSPSPAHVRTARLVAVACGRRAGVAVDRLEELKLAVGEACGRAVARHQRSELTDLVELELIDDDGFEVRVLDYATSDQSAAGADFGVSERSDSFSGTESENFEVAESGGSETVESGYSEALVAAEAGVALLADSADVFKMTAGPRGVGSQVSLWWSTET